MKPQTVLLILLSALVFALVLALACYARSTRDLSSALIRCTEARQ